MKLVAISDIHVMESLARGQDGHARLLATIREQIRRACPDLVVCGGDLAGRTVPHRASPVERNLLIAFFMSLNAPVLIVRGNHDYWGDYEFMNYLKSRITYTAKPQLVQGDGWVVGMLPWLDIARLGMPEDYSEAVTRQYQEAQSRWADDLRRARAEGKSRILLAHAAVQGGLIRLGQPVVPLADPVLDLSAWVNPDLWDLCLLGHYHMHQQVIDSPVPTWYIGSTFAYEYGETGPKGYCVVEMDRYGPSMQLVEVPQTYKGLLEVLDDGQSAHVVCGTMDETVAVEEADQVVNWSKYWKVKIEGTAAEQARDSVWIGTLRARGGAVRLDRRQSVPTQQREAAWRVVRARDMKDKLLAYAKTESPPPEPAVLERAVEILAELEAEDHGI